MDAKDQFHEYLNGCCNVVHAYIKEKGSQSNDGLVSATSVNDGLKMNFSAATKDSIQPTGHKGWLLATLARNLQASGRLVIERKGGRVFYRSVGP